jgi:hypothetical protein
MVCKKESIYTTMIMTKYRRNFTTCKIILKPEESHCLLIYILYFLGIKITTIKETYNTLLDAENAYDYLCKYHERLKYGCVDK